MPETLLAGEHREPTLGHCLLLSVQTQQPIDPTQMETSGPGEGRTTADQHHFELTSGCPFTLASVSFWCGPQHFWSIDLPYTIRRCSGLILFFHCSPPQRSSSPCSGSDTLWQLLMPRRTLLIRLDADTSCFPRAGEWGHESEGNYPGHFPTFCILMS